MAEQQVGTVTHYFGNIRVAAVKITGGEIRVGDTIRIKGRTTDISQVVESMQVEHESVTLARPGDEIGLKTVDHARENDAVYKVTSD